ncbi:MAG: pyridoxal phosphate-dependent aminotransferase [Brevinematia bacterium]
MNIEEVKSFIVMDILERASFMESQGLEIIHLEIGEPDLPTPKKALERISEFLNYKMGYTHSLGLMQLRESISKYYYDEYDVEISPSNIVITPGTSVGMYLLLSILLDKGGEIAILDPSYPCYKNFIKHLGGEIRRINVFKENNFLPEVNELKNALKNSKGFITSSPSNPTGVILNKELIESLLETGTAIIIDEIYQGIVFKENKKELSSIRYFKKDGNLIISNGFSKYFAMPGWRVGWLVLPDEYIHKIQKLLQNIVISTSTLSQLVASVCINECRSELEGYVNIYKERLTIAKTFLESRGLKIGYEIEGSFYIFLDISKFSKNSYEISKKLLEEYLVAITPGIDFGENKTDSFVRISLTNSKENILLGLERLINMFHDYYPSPRSI